MLPLNITINVVEALEQELIKMTENGWVGPDWLKELRNDVEELAQHNLDQQVLSEGDLEFFSWTIDMTSFPEEPT